MTLANESRLDSVGTGGSDEEILVTPAMAREGARIIADYFDQNLDWLAEERAREIYDAMAKLDHGRTGTAGHK